MFEETPSLLLLLTTCNFPKGGDFMGPERNNPARDQAIRDSEASDRLRGLRESEVFYPAGYDLSIDPDQGRVLDERQDPTHPLRKGRIKQDNYSR